MKNFKIYGVLCIGLCVLFLTGCGGSSHTLKCTREEDGNKMSYTFTFNDKEDKLTYVEGKVEREIPSYLSEDEIKETVDELNNDCQGLDKCKAEVSGNKLIATASGKPEYLDFDEDVTLKDFKEEVEAAGYKCS